MEGQKSGYNQLSILGREVLASNMTINIPFLSHGGHSFAIPSLGSPLAQMSIPQMSN